MKRTITIAALVLGIMSCKKEEVTPNKITPVIEDGMHYPNITSSFPNGVTYTSDSIFYFGDSATYYGAINGVYTVNTQYYKR